MRTALGSLRATLVVALGALAVPGVAAAQDPAAHTDTSQRIVRSGDLAAVVSDAPENLRAKRRDLEAHGGWYDAGDHVKFSFPTAMAATPADAAVPALRGMAPDPDGLEGITLPLNNTGSVAPGTVRTPGAPEFGFDVSIQTAGVRFPYLRFPPLPDV
jgi:hypothetical protein